MNIIKGFTIIELLILILIISILAAISISYYRNYIAKSQVSEALSLLSGLKAPLIDLTGSSGLANACSANVAVPADATVTPPVLGSPAGVLNTANGYILTGKYVSGITAVATGTTSCKLTATFKPAGSGLNDKIAGQTVSFTYTVASGDWSCTSSLADSVRPDSCSAGS